MKISEYAKISGFNRSTITKWCKDGVINSKKIQNKWEVFENEFHNPNKTDHIKIKKLFKKIKKTSYCWEWIGATNGKGYGKTSYLNKGIYVHRLIYILMKGGIPDGLQVLHKCDNTLCCNPDHLFLGTHLDNMKDKINKGRHENQKKTHCKEGHPLSGSNLYLYPTKSGNLGRFCKKCSGERVKASRQQQNKTNTLREYFIKNIDGYEHSVKDYSKVSALKKFNKMGFPAEHKDIFLKKNN